MKTYCIEFNGRLSGALGVTYRINATVQAEDEKKAVLKLYDKYEHISVSTIEEVSQ